MKTTRSTIVVGVDGSQESKAALRWALEEARVRRARLVCVHAWAFPSRAVAQALVGTAIDSAVRATHDQAKELLAAAVSEVVDKAAGVPLRQAAIEGPPAQVLIRAAEDADLLVVGSRGLGGFAGLRLGSVSQQCAAYAPCPVVIVRGDRRGQPS